MNYKKLSFLFSVLLHLIAGGFIFIKKIDTIDKNIFFIRLVEFEEKDDRINSKGKIKNVFNKNLPENLYSNHIWQEKITGEEKEEILDLQEREKEEIGKNFENIIKIENEDKGGEKNLIGNNKENLTDFQDLTVLNDKEGNVKKIELDKFSDFPYFKLIRKKISEKIFYPENARRKNIEGRTKIQFTLRKNGELDGIKILKSSGKEILDEVAVEIIKRANPFPKFPEELPFEKIIFITEFNFSLKR